MKRYNWYYIISFTLSLILLFACGDPDDKLSRILRKAGSNRHHLQEVLDHYQNPVDSLKLRAAVFLIENMDGKYSYSGGNFSRFLVFMDSISCIGLSRAEVKQVIKSYHSQYGSLAGGAVKKYDLDVITADFLINNIECAFEVYRTAPWCRNVSFDDFCDYILPYRIGNEAIQEFRPMFLKQYQHLFAYDSLTLQDAADSILASTSLTKVEVLEFPDWIPDFPVSSLVTIRAGSCREFSNLSIYIMRSLGIPVADDFTPQWPHRGFGHSWSSLILGKGKCIDFEGANSNKLGGHLRLSTTNRMAKAYRNTYRIQQNSLQEKHGVESIPTFFQNSLFKDVSSEYFAGVNIEVELKGESNGNHFAYLSVFNNKAWVPIQWGDIKDGRVTFANMGKSAIYMPMIFKDGVDKPIGNPILVDSNGVVNDVLASKDKIEEVVLTRKYPVFDWWNTRTVAMKNGIFQASNNQDFQRCVNVHQITSVPEMTFQRIVLQSPGSFRYWRYLSPDSSFGSIAELQFIDSTGVSIRGQVIGNDMHSLKTVSWKVFDGDPLTMYTSEQPNGNWVGMDFQRPVAIKTINYLCWNDDNFIKSGEAYELFYWSERQWRSLGEKLGNDSQRMVYSNVPQNALLLLRNHTKGVEERIFTYEHGRQIWW